MSHADGRQLQPRPCELSLPYQQPCGLDDVLWETPAILAALSSDDWKALSGSNSQLQSIIHSSVQAVTVKDIADVSLVAQGTWPQLTLILVYTDLIFSTQQSCRIFFKGSKLEVVGHMQLTGKQQNAAAFMVRPIVAVHDTGRQYDVALSPLSHSPWECLSVTMDATIPAEGLIKQLNQLNWPKLVQLTLNNISLDVVATEFLVSGSWTQLKWLKLENNQLNDDGFGVLKKACWSLDALDLVDNPMLTAAAIASIPQARSWPSLIICGFGLSCMPLDSAKLLAIAALPTRLTSLGLCQTGTGAAGMAQLLSVSWPKLQNLSLPDNALTAEAIASLVAIALPSLISLQLDNNLLDETAAANLATSKWHLLERLQLQDNKLDNAAMAALSNADWPLLQMLSLNGNAADAAGVELLAKGQWPKLCVLTLDNTAVSFKVWAVLNLILLCFLSQEVYLQALLCTGT